MGRRGKDQKALGVEVRFWFSLSWFQSDTHSLHVGRSIQHSFGGNGDFCNFLSILSQLRRAYVANQTMPNLMISVGTRFGMGG
ncbi:hypothetical protein V6N13_077468 [Hibiscus sabdariffa]